MNVNGSIFPLAGGNSPLYTLLYLTLFYRTSAGCLSQAKINALLPGSVNLYCYITVTSDVVDQHKIGCINFWETLVFLLPPFFLSSFPSLSSLPLFTPPLFSCLFFTHVSWSMFLTSDHFSASSLFFFLHPRLTSLSCFINFHFFFYPYLTPFVFTTDLFVSNSPSYSVSAFYYSSVPFI